MSLPSSEQDEKFQLPPVVERDSALKKRKASKGKIPADLRRSASTPHIRGLASGDSGVLSPTTDKRRNKLGYHRTSVACGHCRRRKIRCLLPSSEDPQGRCTNCIRLKKECNFYPVDQSGPTEQRPLNTHKKETTSGAPSNSSQSSPRISATSQQGSIPDVQSHVQSPQPDAELHQGPDVPGYGIPHENGMPFPPAPFAFASPSTTGWSPNNLSSHHHQQARPIQQDPSTPYWGVSGTPTTSAYSGDPALAFGQIEAASYGSPGFTYQQGVQSWAQGRSMSFGNIEGMPHQYPYHEVHPQFGQQSQQPGYQFVTHPQLTNPGFSSPEAARGMNPDLASDQSSLQKPWSFAPSAQPVASPSGQPPPVLGSTWYPQPPFVGNEDKRHTNFNHSTQYYPEVSNPG